jgi:hypothetical protein
MTEFTVDGLIITDQSELVICAVYAGRVERYRVDDGSPPQPGIQRWSEVIEADTWQEAALRAERTWNAVDGDLVEDGGEDVLADQIQAGDRLLDYGDHTATSTDRNENGEVLVFFTDDPDTEDPAVYDQSALVKVIRHTSPPP